MVPGDGTRRDLRQVARCNGGSRAAAPVHAALKTPWVRAHRRLAVVAADLVSGDTRPEEDPAAETTASSWFETSPTLLLERLPPARAAVGRHRKHSPGAIVALIHRHYHGALWVVQPPLQRLLALRAWLLQYNARLL